MPSRHKCKGPPLSGLHQLPGCLHWLTHSGPSPGGLFLWTILPHAYEISKQPWATLLLLACLAYCCFLIRSVRSGQTKNLDGPGPCLHQTPAPWTSRSLYSVCIFSFFPSHFIFISLLKQISIAFLKFRPIFKKCHMSPSVIKEDIFFAQSKSPT